MPSREEVPTLKTRPWSYLYDRRMDWPRGDYGHPLEMDSAWHSDGLVWGSGLGLPATPSLQAGSFTAREES